MIGRANGDMLPRLKQLWQTCFEDTPQGTEFVFSNLLHPEQMLVYTTPEHQPVAMVNWKLLPFTTPKNTIKGAYVFGVATLPEFQGRGISQQLMNQLHEVLTQEGVVLSCLVPASEPLFAFYQKQGFEALFFYRAVELEPVLKEPVGSDSLAPASLEDLAPLRRAVYGGRSLFGAWDQHYLQFAGKENALYGGETLAFSREGRGGYAVCRMEGDTLVVREAVADREDIVPLGEMLCRRFGAKRCRLRLPVDFPGELPGTNIPFAMVKWYDQALGQTLPDRQGDAPWFAFGLD